MTALILVMAVAGFMTRSWSPPAAVNYGILWAAILALCLKPVSGAARE